MKLNYTIAVLLFSCGVFAQDAKDELFIQDLNKLVEELEFMYGYDQTMREFLVFKTFDKSETDRIENLPSGWKSKELAQRKFVSDSLSKQIWKNYIIPKDAEHTQRMIAIIKKYGFPNIDRIEEHYQKDFIDPEFNPYILLVHAPEQYWEELKVLLKSELEVGRISNCSYGHILWHITGRESFKPMLDNGYTMLEENGKTILKPNCE